MVGAAASFLLDVFEQRDQRYDNNHRGGQAHRQCEMHSSAAHAQQRHEPDGQGTEENDHPPHAPRR